MPVRAGESVLGIRAGTPALGALLRGFLEDRVVEDADPPGNVSVHLAARSDGAATDLHRLYETYTRTLRTRSIERILTALWQALDGHDVRAAAEVPLLGATVLIREGGAHLLPARVRGSIVDEERRWRADGFALVERRWVALEPAGWRIVVPAPRADRVASLVPAIVGEGIEHRDEDPAPVGSFPIVSWTPAARTASPAARIQQAAAQLLDRTAHDTASLVSALVPALENIPAVTDWRGVDSLREALVALRADGA